MDGILEHPGASRLETILLAEDDSNDSLLFSIAFRKAGLKANLQVVEDGDQVISYLQGLSPFEREEHPFPKLLLLDLKMPRRDGFSLLEWLFWRPRLRPQHIVVLSASDRPLDVHKARRLGADGYLVKPHTPHELTNLVKCLSEHWELVNSRSAVAV